MRGYTTVTQLLRDAHVQTNARNVSIYKKLLGEAGIEAHYDKLYTPKTDGIHRQRYNKKEATALMAKVVEEIKKISKNPEAVGRAPVRRPKIVHQANGVARPLKVTLPPAGEPISGVLLAVQYGQNKTITLTVKEAQDIRTFLNELWGVFER